MIEKPLMSDKQLSTLKARLYAPPDRPDCLVWSDVTSFMVNGQRWHPARLLLAMRDGVVNRPLVRTCGLKTCLNIEHIEYGDYEEVDLPLIRGSYVAGLPRER